MAVLLKYPKTRGIDAPGYGSNNEPLKSHLWPGSVEHPHNSTPGIFKPISGLCRSLLASHRATLHDFKALSYGPARALAYDRAWVPCVG
jgi:hypothetical protein